MTGTAGARTGALLIHGLGGTQYDLGPMHKALRRAGVETHAITLPGHGSAPEDLTRVRAEEWLDAVLRAYDDLVGRYETFHVIGMCMGALLALVLAERRPLLNGRLVAMAAPVYIDGWSTPWYRLLRHPVYRLPWLPARMRVDEDEPFGIKNDLVRAVVKAKFERGDNFHYRWVPLSCLRQVDRLRGWVLRGAHRIGWPTLVIHAREDELTSLRSADFLTRTVPDVRTVVVDNSYHMICVDNDREQVVGSVLGFLGFEPGMARRKAHADVEVPMSAEAVATLVDEYLRALTTRHFEAMFTLMAPEALWRFKASHPLAGAYDGRDAVVAMFARVAELTGGTLRLAVTDGPRIDGQSAEVELSVSYVADGREVVRRGAQLIRCRNGRIVSVEQQHDEAAQAGADAAAVVTGVGPAGTEDDTPG